MDDLKKEELKQTLRHEMKLYRIVSYYFVLIGGLSLASPFLFKRAFSGPDWTIYCFALAGALLLTAYALHALKQWAMPVAVCSLLASGLGQLYFNPLATYAVFGLPAIISGLLIHQHLKLIRLIEKHTARTAD